MMNLERPQIAYRLRGPTSAVLICVVAAMLFPTFAVASESEFCQEARLGTGLDAFTLEAGASDRTKEPRLTPCERAQQAGVQDYNLCFEANPNPSTTVPDWMARWQADEAVVAVFNTVVDLHRQRASENSRRLQPLEHHQRRRWLADAIKAMELAEIPKDRGLICLEPGDENCEQAPSPAHSQSLSTLISVDRPADLESLRVHLDKEPGQLALIDLRVGPALEHRRLLDRPPPV